MSKDRLTSNKELKAILNEAKQEGWEFRTGGRHIKGVHPATGKTTTISISPSDYRVMLNIKKHLRIEQ